MRNDAGGFPESIHKNRTGEKGDWMAERQVAGTGPAHLTNIVLSKQNNRFTTREPGAGLMPEIYWNVSGVDA